MPLDIDLMDNEIIAGYYRRGREEGREEGREQGELTLLRRLIEKRFGAIPEWPSSGWRGVRRRKWKNWASGCWTQQASRSF